MKNKNWIKISLDIVMTALLVFLYNKRIINISFHEIAGIILCGLFIIHTLLNWKWVAGFTKKLFHPSINMKTRIMYGINILLSLLAVFILVSGLLMSKTFPTSIKTGVGIWKTVHFFSAALMLVLTGIHVGLNWRFVVGMFHKVNPLPPKISKATSIILTVVILVFGTYNIFTSSFGKWISMPFAVNQVKEQTKDSEQIRGSGQQGTTGQGNASQGKRMPPQGEAGQDDTNQSRRMPPQGENGNTYQDGNARRPIPPNEGGFRPNGKQGQQNQQGLPGKGKDQPRNTGAGDVFRYILTYLSIMGVFAIITHYITVLAQRKQKIQVIEMH